MSAAHNYLMILRIKSASEISGSRAPVDFSNPVRDVCDTYTNIRVTDLINKAKVLTGQNHIC